MTPAALWARWAAHTSAEVDARPLHLARVGIGLALAGDALSVLWRGASDVVLAPASLGGLAQPVGSTGVFLDTAWGGWLWWSALLVAAAGLVTGFRARPAALLAVVASAQLGQLCGPGDRGIDRLLRTVLLVLACSRATDAAPPARVPRWPIDLVRWLLAIVYLQAGVVKVDADPGFLDPQLPELYTMMTEPFVGRLDPVTWHPLRPLFVAGGLAALVLELSAPLLLTRWAPVWAVFGAAMHLGIAATLELGMFPFGMLALYPVLFAPWLAPVTPPAALPRSPGS